MVFVSTYQVIVMGEVVPFKKPKLSEKFKGRELCKSGFHKWVVVQENHFDVKQGKLVTSYRCSRCGATRNEAR
jgi:hypothetical protein